ncbi:MAG: AAA family ATPase, partial [Candidatus Niyogibacteria bacterium]|nr:AAA family ATPase [Candidatus Niyogibacteria bacterium]
MRHCLRKLELSGFKSFAKQTYFDFPDSITAIVGPNGSGKSNIAEALRWVLGEQSLKSLRGKKGEDLIFNGSQSAPRLSKASVALYFDNSLRQFPVEFEEVVIGRRIYRDGQGEYLLNGSQVRLKDIVELLSHVGLGVSQHHIISQGEADRILYISPKERQEAIEDALGLKIYQFKRMEAERKLRRTEENMRQADALQKEIKPHLKHLERMVEKYKKASEIKISLEKLLNEYMSRFKSTVEKAEELLNAKKEKPVSDLAILENKIALAKKDPPHFSELEEEPKDLRLLDQKIAKLVENKIKAERDIGRLEGLIEAASSETPDEGEAVSREEVEELIAGLEDSLSSAMDTDVVEEIYAIIQEVLSRLRSFLGGITLPREKPAGEELLKKKKMFEEALLKLKAEEKELSEEKEKLNSAFYSLRRERRLAEEKLLGLEVQANDLKNSVRILDLEEEKIKLQRAEFERDLEEARRFLGEEKLKLSAAEIFSENEREKARKEIDRLKFRLEEAGGMDPAVVKEYEEIKGRDEFFSKELGDLGQAAKSLRQISKELAQRIEKDFNQGIEKINKEFQNFFETMFGGGKARLTAVLPDTRFKKEDEEENSADEEEEAAFSQTAAAVGGLDIDVAL